ncbi:MAG: DnaB-like helicase N-terminal domain-containing protein, partial [Mycobacteriales bacterium]
MAVAEELRTLTAAPEFERQPPQDLAAEQSVLGGMLLSKDAIADVVEVLHPGDFYRPAHQLVYDVVLDLYGRGEPADPITVSAELTKRGEIGRAGGAPYLHTLISSVPTAANAGYYARIVAEQAILRRLVEAGTRIVQLGYGSAGGGGLEVDDVVDRAQQAVYDVTERRTSEDYVVLEQLLQPAMDEIESIGNRGGVMSGVPTGFADLDSLLNGLHPGQMVIVAARPAIGKALALDTPLPTPTGWTTMGEVEVGDELLGADGRPTCVVAATAVMRDRPCFAVTFSDGETIIADAQHQWLTECVGGPPTVHTTEQIAAGVHGSGAGVGPNYSVANCEPIAMPGRPLPIPAYAFGVWLGDGHSTDTTYTHSDPEIVWHLEGDGVVVDEPGRLQAHLHALGVLYDKHIPAAYLRRSEVQRRALLAGLLDTAGTVTSSGALQFATRSRRLAEGVRELVTSLGYCCDMATDRTANDSAALHTV